MNSDSPFSVLLVEDDKDWQYTIERDCKELGWQVIIKDNIPEAISLIRSDNHHFDLLIADKGGSNASRGGTDIIGHRDGLSVIREMKELHPACIRVLETGEKWSFQLFDDKTLGLHVFIDKAYWAENGENALQMIADWDTVPILDRPVVFDRQTPSRREY